MEMYLAIIKVLDNDGVLAQQQIMRKAGITTVQPEEFLNFLVKLGIIEERKYGSKTTYALTGKGQRLYAYFALDDDASISNGAGMFRID